jgi:hypothetical protein
LLPPAQARPLMRLPLPSDAEMTKQRHVGALRASAS